MFQVIERHPRPPPSDRPSLKCAGCNFVAATATRRFPSYFNSGRYFLYTAVVNAYARVETMTTFWRYSTALLTSIGVLFALAPAHAADEPDLIFKRSTVFKWLTPNDKLATYGLDDPEVEGVACHFTVPEKGD